MDKLKFGDKLTVRNIELQVLTDTYENVQYYFLSKGRSLLDTLGIIEIYKAIKGKDLDGVG